MCAPKYKIYPSLLDTFQRYLESEKDFEGYANEDAEGGYKRSLEEISQEREQALLDAVNRVPHETTEAQLKGTIFNDIIDYQAHTRAGFAEDGIASIYMRECSNGWQVCEVKLQDGGYYEFNGRDINHYAEQYRGAVSQYLCKATLPTRFGEVLLYGYVDEICGDTVKDIKTTSRYDFGKFASKWQKELYPYCLVASGDLPGVVRFDYDVYVWRERKGEPIGVERYTESYDYDHERATRRLVQGCEALISWLEANRHRITDTKVFGA